MDPTRAAQREIPQIPVTHPHIVVSRHLIAASLFWPWNVANQGCSQSGSGWSVEILKSLLVCNNVTRTVK